MQKKTIQLFWKFSKPYAKRRNTALLFGVLSVALESYVATYILSMFVNHLQIGKVTFESSLDYITLYALVQFVSTVVTWRITLWATWSFEVRGQRDLGNAILTKLTEHSLSFHNDRFGGALISQTSKLVGAFERFWDMIIWDTLPVITGVVVASVILWSVSPVYSIMIVGITVVFSAAVFWGSGFMLKRNRAEVTAYSRVTGFIADVVTNISTVKAFGTEASEQKIGFARQHEWMNRSLSSMRGFLGVSTVYATLLSFFYIATMVYTVYLVSQRSLPIGSVYLLLTYTFSVGYRMWSINGIMRTYNRLMGDAHDMVEIMNDEASIRDKATKKLTAPHGAITFEHVSFAHDNGKGIEIFQDFSLAIKPGERVGLVGPSGSGKTTLTKLLLRFNDIDQGTISIDGSNIATVTQKSLRETISYVAQEPMLFHRSLAENIAYGRPNATTSDIKRAAELAYASEFIET